MLIGTARASPPPVQGILDLGGELTLDELVALVATADCVISTDSGPYHLAGATGRLTLV